MTAIEQLRRSGIRRTGTPKAGFRYAGPSGREVSARQLERIRAMKIPPACDRRVARIVRQLLKIPAKEVFK